MGLALIIGIGMRGLGGIKEESTSFLKKRSKKLLLPATTVRGAGLGMRCRREQKFFDSFFQKRTTGGLNRSTQSHNGMRWRGWRWASGCGSG